MTQWIEVQSREIEQLNRLASEMNINPLVIEDCIHRDQRPKLEEFDNHQFIVWFMIFKEKIYEIQLIVFPNALIIVPHEPPPSHSNWKEFLKISTDQMDTDHLLYSTLDKLTDITWSELRKIYAKITVFEEDMFDKESDPRTLLKLKNIINRIEYAVGHLPSVAHQLQNLIKPKNDLRWKLRDLTDHCERVNQSLSIYRAQIASTIDLYWGHQSNRSNKQIKRLTLMASMALPMSFWASFWGMNFESIPFKNVNLFYIALATMVLSAITTVWILVKKGYWSD